MAYNFEKEFVNAVENTQNLGYQLDFLGFNHSRYFNNQDQVIDLFNKINNTLQKVAEIKYPPLMKDRGIALSIIANCGPFHHFIKPIVEDHFNCKAYITLGYISLDNDKYFHRIDLDVLKKALQEKQFPKQHHIWLTLESGEIFDLTFGITYRSVNDPDFDKELDDGVPLSPVMKHPSELVEGMQYHPIAVEEEIIASAGYSLDRLSDILYSA